MTHTICSPWNHRQIIHKICLRSHCFLKLFLKAILRLSRPSFLHGSILQNSLASNSKNGIIKYFHAEGDQDGEERRRD